MSEVWRKTESDYRIVIWHSIELMEELVEYASLSDKERIEFNSFRSETRKREWITVRNILKYLLPEEHHSITYNNNGRPLLIGGYSVSISHSNDFIAVMLAGGNRIGVDLEIIHPRIEVLARKFVSEDESKLIDENNRLEKLHVIWGAKEVLFKIHSIGELDFKKHLYVHPFEYHPAGSFKASIKKKNFEKDFIVYYEKFKQYMVSWAIESPAI